MGLTLYAALHKVQSLLFGPYCSLLKWIAGKARAESIAQELEGCELLLVTVAYNKPDLIRAQTGFVQQNVADSPCAYMVVDNSSDSRARSAIKDLCRERGVAYVAVPKYFHLFLWPRIFYYGISEGMALNWFCGRLLPKINPRRFAIIDQDIMPLRKYAFGPKLGDEPFYGVGRVRSSGWYLWPGFMVFNYRQVAKAGFDFMPCYVKGVYFDTGGGNYATIFSHYDWHGLTFANAKTVRYAHGKDDGTLNIYHRDCIQIVDGAWLHLINGSNYAHLKKKDSIMAHIMNNLDQLPLPGEQ